MKHSAWGILAHVDAGKTTLSEQILLETGVLRAAGRVDKGNTFLDTDAIERERGITIFSKPAIFSLGENEITIIDTPGHADFAAETERALSVMDGAILVISATDGVQSHTRTLWRLLSSYNIPTIVFVNKMDQPGNEKSDVLSNIEKGLGGGFCDFTDIDSEECQEAIAMCDEAILEDYLTTGALPEGALTELFYNRKMFPVFFGSALKSQGVTALLDGWRSLLDELEYADGIENAPFGARVYKIGHDERGERLTYLKVVSGRIAVRDAVGEDKITAIRRYNGQKFAAISEATTGMVCTVTGLTDTYAGQGLGTCEGDTAAVLTPVIERKLIFPEGTDITKIYPRLQLLSQESPELDLVYDEDAGEIRLRVMGQVHTEVLKREIKDRFNLDVDFGNNRIVYKETIAGGIVEGVGHFEPLRHYAEVHLLMEPGEPGSGIVVDTICSEDILDRNWQHLVLGSLRGRRHKGVLTGSLLTDVRITLASGRAHVKHTEGGDFSQATRRAVRHALMQAESRLLEPFYSFRLEVPQENVGRAMTDMERLHATGFTQETAPDGSYILKGRAPVACMAGYGADVLAYTGGLGQLTLSVDGYGPCHNPDEVIEERAYEPERDVRNTADSVFCSHGSGDVIPWSEVTSYMHLPSVLSPTKELTDEQIRYRAKRQAESMKDTFIAPDEVDRIVSQAGSANKKPVFIPHKGINRRTPQEKIAANSAGQSKPPKPKPILPEYMLVDGYNVIFAWSELSALAARSVDGARDALLDVLCNYQAMRGIEIIAVFDAYKRQNHPEEYRDYNNIHVVFTRTAETADHYIERFAHTSGKNYRTTVVTSDGMEQVIVLGAGANIISSREFELEVKRVTEEFNERHGVK